MQTIGPFPASDNNGGGCYLLLAEHDAVENVPVPTSESVPPLVLLPGKEYICIVPSNGSLSFSEDEDQESGDSSYSVNVGLILPKNHPDRLAFQRRTKGRRYILIYVDRNNSAVMIGCSSQPVKLIYGREFGAEFTDLNHVAIGCRQTFYYPAPFYDGFEASQPGEITIPGSGGGGSTTVMMQAKYAHDGTYSYMGLAPLSASTSDTLWTVRRLEFNTEGELTEDLSATGAWDNYDSLTYT